MTRVLIRGGRVIDPASNFDQVAVVAVAAGRILSIAESAPPNFSPDHVIDASGCLVIPGLVDLCARLGEPGHEHEGMLESETAAAVAGGITSVVCPPDTDPVLDEPGLVQMLQFRSAKLRRCRVHPLGALTRRLEGEILTEMIELTQAGCVGFGQAEVSLANTQVLLRAMQYAATFGYRVWLRPEEMYLGRGVAASGALATRLGLSGIPVVAETIALHTIFDLARVTGARVHLCRLSSAAGVDLVRVAKSEGLAISCDVSVNSLHLTDIDISYFDSRARLRPPLRQQGDRAALRQALWDGTIDALVSDHSPVSEDRKTLPFAEAEPGATGLELLLSLALKWGEDQNLRSDSGPTRLMRALRVLSCQPAAILQDHVGQDLAGIGRLAVGALADICVVDPAAHWTVSDQSLSSQGKHTPFAGQELPGRVRATLVGGDIAYQTSHG